MQRESTFVMRPEHYDECMKAVGEETADRMKKETYADNSARLEHLRRIEARLSAEPWSVACDDLGEDGPAWRWDGATVIWNLSLEVVFLEVEPDPELNTHVNDIHQLYARAIIETVDQETADRIAAVVGDKFRDMGDLCLCRREFLGPMRADTLRWGVDEAEDEDFDEDEAEADPQTAH